jgi:hypothetical protein
VHLGPHPVQGHHAAAASPTIQWVACATAAWADGAARAQQPRMMNKLALALILSFSATACGDAFDDALEQFEGYKKKMCACKDAACADKVKEDWRTWRKGLKSKLGDTKPSEAQDKKGKAIDDAMDACEDKARGTTP